MSEQEQQPTGPVRAAAAAAAEKGPRRRNNPGRSRVGCLTCRAKHVKCDERLPTCRRCERLGLSCEPYWAKHGPPPSLEQMPPLQRLLRPRCEEGAPMRTTGTTPDESQMRRLGSPSAVSPNVASSSMLVAPSPDSIGGWMDLFSLPLEDEPSDQTMQTMDPRELLLGMSSHTQIQPPLPTYHIPLPNSMILCRDEHLALRHYETVFALSQTPKDPLWSFPRLLLHKTSYSATTMHFALATSLHELDAQREVHEDPGPGDTQMSLYRARAHRHFEDASSTFKGVVPKDRAADHLETLSCFYFIYVYMSCQRVVDRPKLDRLSRTVAEYLRTFSLDTFLTTVPAAAGPALHSLLCRLLLWLFKEDVDASFFGCAGAVARYFRDRPRSLMNVWEVSRPALPLNWDREYPEAQSAVDMESSLPVDMTIELMQLEFDVIELGRSGVVPAPPSPAIETAFAQMEMKYHFVFRVSAFTKVAVGREAAAIASAGVAIFYAWKICYHRFITIAGDGDGDDVVDGFLKLLLPAAQRATSATDISANLKGLQWALLVAGAETRDPIHREWIASKLTIPRCRAAFRTMTRLEAQTGRPVGVRNLGDLLAGASTFS